MYTHKHKRGTLVDKNSRQFYYPTLMFVNNETSALNHTSNQSNGLRHRTLHPAETECIFFLAFQSAFFKLDQSKAQIRSHPNTN